HRFELVIEYLHDANLGPLKVHQDGYRLTSLCLKFSDMRDETPDLFVFLGRDVRKVNADDSHANVQELSKARCFYPADTLRSFGFINGWASRADDRKSGMREREMLQHMGHRSSTPLR
ncbi:MAG TPA: hypothetical protein VK475_11050, partial [Pyrinomonadaceae bacterium]|nr:hypothetical protein [Pyrinomonadaceae bacterium]